MKLILLENFLEYATTSSTSKQKRSRVYANSKNILTLNDASAPIDPIANKNRNELTQLSLVIYFKP